MAQYIWKKEMASIYKKADAEKVGKEISEFGDSVSPKQMVEKARSESSAMHDIFEWDDSIAAEQYRITQAREVLRCLIRLPDENKGEREPVRAYFSLVHGQNSYKKSEIVLSTPSDRNLLLLHAALDLRTYKEKYRKLTELEDFWKSCNTALEILEK